MREAGAFGGDLRSNAYEAVGGRTGQSKSSTVVLSQQQRHQAHRKLQCWEGLSDSSRTGPSYRDQSSGREPLGTRHKPGEAAEGSSWGRSLMVSDQ